MAIVYFPALIERGDHGYGVIFPDLPGCVSAGDTLQEAALNAEEALSGHLAVMVRFGEPVPVPSTLDEVELDEDLEEAGRILVRADCPGRDVCLELSLEAELIAAIDRVSGDRHAFITNAVRAALAGQG